MRSKKILIPLIFMAFAMMWTGCDKDYNYVAPQVTTPVSFKNDIYNPIFSSTCVTGCHTTGDDSPDMSTDSIAYAQMWNNANGDTLINIADPTSSILYVRISSTNSKILMPKGGPPLSSTQLATILAWIQQGAKNN